MPESLTYQQVEGDSKINFVQIFLASAQCKSPEALIYNASGPVEHSGFEPLTPTLPVWCATSCANAPRTGDILTQVFRFVKSFFPENFLI